MPHPRSELLRSLDSLCRWPKWLRLCRLFWRGWLLRLLGQRETSVQCECEAHGQKNRKLTGKVTLPLPHPCTNVPVSHPKSIQELIPCGLATAPDPMIAILLGFCNGSRFPEFFSRTMPSRATARAVAVWFAVCTFRPLPPPLAVTPIAG